MIRHGLTIVRDKYSILVRRKCKHVEVSNTVQDCLVRR